MNIQKTYFTVYNEIDDEVYEGTPIFHTFRDAERYLHQSDGRPSSKVVNFNI